MLDGVDPVGSAAVRRAAGLAGRDTRVRALRCFVDRHPGVHRRGPGLLAARTVAAGALRGFPQPTGLRPAPAAARLPGTGLPGRGTRPGGADVVGPSAAPDPPDPA